MKRRSFISTSVAAGLASTALGPVFDPFTARAYGRLNPLARLAAAAGTGRVLVVVQLDGGNDGINTVVPFKDEGYAKHRKAIRLPEKRLIPITGEPWKAGSVYAKRTLALNASRTLDNTQGVLRSDGSLSLRAASLGEARSVATKRNGLDVTWIWDDAIEHELPPPGGRCAVVGRCLRLSGAQARRLACQTAGKISAGEGPSPPGKFHHEGFQSLFSALYALFKPSGR